MPLLGNGEYREPLALNGSLQQLGDRDSRTSPPRKQSQHSVTARIAMNNFSAPNTDSVLAPEENGPAKKVDQRTQGSAGNLTATANGFKHGVSNGSTLSDTPSTTAPNSPNM